MFPYYHPTTIAVVDDDPLFLDSFHLRFSEERLLRTWSDPVAFIRNLVGDLDNSAEAHRFVVSHDGDGGAFGDRVIRIDVAAIAGLIRTAGRFRQTSVAIIDYDMPVMNGLQVCRALGNFPIRKILLTGKADVQTGVTALNEGLIDCYIAKQDRNLTQSIRASIARQRDAYFADITRALRTVLGEGELAFLAEPALDELVGQLYSGSGYVEHYVTVERPGILFLTADSKAAWMVIESRENMASQAQIAKEGAAPTELVSMLEACRVIPAFPDGYYTNDLSGAWRNYLLPARHLCRDWFYAISGNVPGLDKLIRGAVGIDAYTQPYCIP